MRAGRRLHPSAAKWLCLLAFSLLLAGCELRFGAQPTPTATATPTPAPVLGVVWVSGGDLYLWREDAPTPRILASGGVGQPHLSPGGSRVAFTRAAARSLWVVGTDGTGEQELVTQEVIPSRRGGTPQIDQLRWLGETAVYFNTRQQFANGTVQDDNLYRAALDENPRLVLPPGTGGNFAIGPDGEHIAVISAGSYDTQEGRVSILDPLGVDIEEKLSFTAFSTPDEPPLYPPLSWIAEGSSVYVRIPIPSRETDRVPLWNIPPQEAAAIFGFISAAPQGLPLWAGARMLYLRASEAAGFDLVLANYNGENPQLYATGAISDPRWLPDGTHFAYHLNGALWLGQAGAAPRLLLDPAPSRVVFLPGGTFVYAADALLRGSYLEPTARTELIAQAAAPLLFDAALLR